MKEIKIDSCLKESIPSFIGHIKEHSRRLISLCDEKDIGEIKRLAHNIKGAGGGYGFDEISAIGEEIEKLADEGDTEKIKKKALCLGYFFDEIRIIYI